MTTTPIIASIFPSSADAGTATFTLTVNGAAFESSSTVYWNGAEVPTTFVSDSQLTATIASSLFPIGGIYTVQVHTPITDLPAGDSPIYDMIGFTENLSVSEAQVIVSDLIDEHRALLSQGYFTWNGHPFACDPVSKGNVIGACVLAIANGGNLPAGYVWRDDNNVNVPVTGQQMIAIGVEMFSFLSACYQAAWIHKANVEAITTSTGDVLAYNYLGSLWPSPDTQI